MINKKLDFSTAPEFIQQFENDHFEELKQFKFHNWPLWQIVKVPLFYRLLQNDEPVKVTSGTQRMQSKIVNAWIESINFLKVILTGNKNRPILCVTHSADCLSKKEGKFYNSLFDYIVSQKKQFPILHWEYSSKAKNPRYNKPHVNIYAAKSFFYRINKKQQAIQYSAADFFIFWNKYLSQKNVDTSLITENFINNICTSFYQSYRFWKFSLKRTTPSKIFSSEKMGTGILAAANELHIPFYEFQHGNIDKNYPPYVWNEGWNKVINNVKPAYLIVFGHTAEKMVLASGFFSKENVSAVGYEKMEDYRNHKPADKGYVFFALQPMMHELNKRIVNCIKQLSEKYKVAVKYHPLQSEDEIREYDAILMGSNVVAFDRGKNIYDCILESRIIVSHVSTVLEEALSLGKISVTIATENLPQGIHSMTGNSYLRDVIIPISINELSNFVDAMHKNDLLENANESLQRFQFEIYESDYYSNILKLIKNETD